MKYYTPKLDELHLGFECEWNDPNEDDFWRPSTITYEEDLYHTIQDLKLGDGLKHRVKHLDHQDIESLGFSIMEYEGRALSTPSEIWFTKKDPDNSEYSYTLVFEPPIDNVREYSRVLIMHRFTSASDILTLFSGIIKNKSELKTIMNMLEIIS